MFLPPAKVGKFNEENQKNLGKHKRKHPYSQRPKTVIVNTWVCTHHVGEGSHGATSFPWGVCCAASFSQHAGPECLTSRGVLVGVEPSHGGAFCSRSSSHHWPSNP